MSRSSRSSVVASASARASSNSRSRSSSPDSGDAKLRGKAQREAMKKDAKQYRSDLDQIKTLIRRHTELNNALWKQGGKPVNEVGSAQLRSFLANTLAHLDELGKQHTIAVTKKLKRQTKGGEKAVSLHYITNRIRDIVYQINKGNGASWVINYPTLEDKFAAFKLDGSLSSTLQHNLRDLQRYKVSPSYAMSQLNMPVQEYIQQYTDVNNVLRPILDRSVATNGLITKALYLNIYLTNTPSMTNSNRFHYSAELGRLFKQGTTEYIVGDQLLDVRGSSLSGDKIQTYLADSRKDGFRRHSERRSKDDSKERSLIPRSEVVNGDDYGFLYLGFNQLIGYYSVPTVLLADEAKATLKDPSLVANTTQAVGLITLMNDYARSLVKPGMDARTKERAKATKAMKAAGAKP